MSLLTEKKGGKGAVMKEGKTKEDQAGDLKAQRWDKVVESVYFLNGVILTM